MKEIFIGQLVEVGNRNLMRKNNIDEQTISVLNMNDEYSGLVHHTIKRLCKRFDYLTIKEVNKFIESQFNLFIKAIL